MRVFIAVLILIFGIQSWTKADDISDFQIEGMSIGDSLLDYLSEEEIINSKRNYYVNRKYYVVAYNKPLEIYDTIEIYLKSKDKNYIIETITGKLLSKNKKQCLQLKKNISKDIITMFPNKETYSADGPHKIDKSGKSKIYQTVFMLSEKKYITDHIRVECVFFSKKIKDKYDYEDTLNVVVMTTKIEDWIRNETYN